MNSTMDDSGYVPLIHCAPDLTMPGINILRNCVFFALFDLNSQKAYKTHGISTIAPKNCPSGLNPSAP